MIPSKKDKNMKVLFMGTPEFAAICLQHLIESDHEVVGVVTVPDKPAGRGQKITQSAVAKLALQNNLKLLQPHKLKSPDFIEELNQLQADVFVVVAFRMLPKEVWQIPPKGTFNLHASLLPDYRGAAPINWAIINGETKTGVTTFLIDEQIDTGNILLKEETLILPDDNAGTLHDKLVEIGKKLIVKTLDELENNTIQPKVQPETEIQKNAPKIFKNDCKIDWEDDIENIANKIRGLSPYPVAWTEFVNAQETKQLKIYKGNFKRENIEESNKGKVELSKTEMKVYASNGIYFVEELQLEGKRRMTVQDFINGLNERENLRVG